MLRVYIKPSSIWITPYTLGTCRVLEKKLSVWDVYASRYVSRLYNFCKEEGASHGVIKIPKGFGIEEVKSALEADNLEYTVIDHSNVYADPRKINLVMKKQPRSDIQVDSNKFLIENRDGQMFLALDVGVGKTYCGTSYIVENGEAAMIISYNLSKQWCDRLTDYTNAVSGTDIVLVVGSSYLEDIAKKRVRPTASIYLVSISTLTSYMSIHGDDSIQEIADRLGIGVKIFDEAHNRYVQFNNIDQNMQTKKTLYLTATPGRSAKEEDRMYVKIYKDVKTYGSFTSLLNNHYLIHYLTINSEATAADRSGMRTPKGFSSMKYTGYLINKYCNEICNMIWNYAKPIFDADKNAKILIITDLLVSIEAIRNYYLKYNSDLSVGTYCVLVNDKKLKEAELEKNIIIGTIGSMQNGKDVSNLQAIFCLSQFASPIVSRQLLGRLRPIRGKEVHYYDLADRSVPDTMKERYSRNAVFVNRCKGEIDTDSIDLSRF